MQVPHEALPAGVATGRPLLEFSSRDGSLWVNGAPLILKGINWYGFETEQGAVHGELLAGAVAAGDGALDNAAIIRQVRRLCGQQQNLNADSAE